MSGSGKSPHVDAGGGGVGGSLASASLVPLSLGTAVRKRRAEVTGSFLLLERWQMAFEMPCSMWQLFKMRCDHVTQGCLHGEYIYILATFPGVQLIWYETSTNPSQTADMIYQHGSIC